MKQATLGKWQIVIGAVAILFWLINFVVTGVVFKAWRVGTDTSTLLIVGILLCLQDGTIGRSDTFFRILEIFKIFYIFEKL